MMPNVRGCWSWRESFRISGRSLPARPSNHRSWRIASWQYSEGITDKGARHLAESPAAQSVGEVVVDAPKLTEEGREALRGKGMYVDPDAYRQLEVESQQQDQEE